jgi:hypothetical protein
VEFTVKASRGKITMAAGIRFILEARHPVGWKVSFPNIEESVGGLLVKDQQYAPPRLDDSGIMVITREYRLEPLSPGLHLIPPLELMVSEGRGEYVSTLRSDVIPILVTSLLLEGPAEPRLLDMTIFPDHAGPRMLLLIRAGAVSAVGAGVILLKRKPFRPAPREMQPLWKNAQEELDSLLAERLIERGEHRLFYDRLFSFLRSYVNDRFLVRTWEKTTEELVNAIMEDRRLGEHRATLADLFSQCDLGRFSQNPPPPAGVSESVTRLRAFLRDTGSIDDNSNSLNRGGL